MSERKPTTKKDDSFLKAFRADGFDFYTGKTINYAESIGKKVSVPKEHMKDPPVLCSVGVLHASRTEIDLVAGRFITSYPFRIVRVKGEPVVQDSEKAGFKELTVLSEEKDLDALFGVRWANMEKLSVDPTKVSPREVTEADLAALKEYAGLRDLQGLWGLRLSYLISEVVTDREKWLLKHIYLIEPCEALIRLVKAGLIPTKDGDEWTLWHYVGGKWVEAAKAKVDATAITRALNKKYEEAVA